MRSIYQGHCCKSAITGSRGKTARNETAGAQAAKLGKSSEITRWHTPRYAEITTNKTLCTTNKKNLLNQIRGQGDLATEQPNEM